MNHADIEVSDIDNVSKTLGGIRPDIVLNTSAYHNVPVCEQNPDTAFSINGRGVLNLAKVCSDLNARFVHYSTDYVFDGLKESPYVESDYANPLNVYGVTKTLGRKLCPQL